MYIVWNTACSTAECSGACSIDHKKKNIRKNAWMAGRTDRQTDRQTDMYTYGLLIIHCNWCPIIEILKEF